MISADDIKQMQADAVAVRDDNSWSIEIRRGGANLPAQTVRIVARGSGSRTNSTTAEESRSGVLVMGDTNLDIQVEDRFNVNEALYRVVFVDPDHVMRTAADAVAVE